MRRASTPEAQASPDDLILSAQASTPHIASLSANYAFGTRTGTDYGWFVDASCWVPAWRHRREGDRG